MRAVALISIPATTLALSSVAYSQNAITGGQVQAHATFTNVGVTATITGDGNSNATAALQINVDGAGFRPAHRLSRSAADRFVGSAMYLPPGKSFEVRVTLTDPDGVTSGVLTGSGTTRVLAVPESTGATLHVSTSGDDGSGNGSASAPFRTIAHGLSEAKAGDTVLVHAGTYHEAIQMSQGGTATAPLTLRSAGDGQVVVDGADPGLKQASAWTDSGSGIWRAASPATRYLAVDGVRLWRFESLAELQAATASGFFYDGSQVHVRLPNGATPTGHEIQVSTLRTGFWLESAPYVVIRGLTIRCYGSEQYAEGIMVRDGSHGVWIVENKFENVMPGIWVKNDVDDLTVMDNEFSDVGLAGFAWDAVKGQGGMESGAIALDNQYDGQGIVFYRNTVHDSFDGLHICGDSEMTHPNNADVIDNYIGHVGDDGIETDGTCSNVRIIGNRFEDALCGVSAAPAVGGPTWVIRNLMVDLKNVAQSTWMTRALKFNVGDDRPSGEVFVYHNTATTYEADQPAFGVTDDSIWTAVHLRNNIWMGMRPAFYYVNAGDEPFFQDYDLLHASASSDLVYYQGQHYDSIAGYSAATSQCLHCVSGNPLFAGTGDYALGASSPAVDKGEVIPGINDGYAGAGPDMGAFELGGIGPSYPDGGTSGTGGSPGAGGASGSGAGAGGGGGHVDAGKAGTGGGSAAGGGPSNSAAPAAENDDGGCGCRTQPLEVGRGGLQLAGLLGLSMISRRRRRS
jgi:hypothetical protein